MMWRMRKTSIAWMPCIVALLLVVLDCKCRGERIPMPRRPPFQMASKYVPRHVRERLVGDHSDGRPPLSRCQERWRDAKLDHFSFPLTSETKTFKQRFFICDQYWRPGGSILFYTGNEADVTLYLNNSGLLFELAPKFDAMVVWAEHRYYGNSKPFGSGPGLYKNASTMAWLTTEQAMADYAELIFELKNQLKDPKCPVIVAGGSYGGMLATWMRLKYPHLVDGALAASAPIWTYLYEDPPWDPGSFAEVVTKDASPEMPAGSAAECVPNAREAWRTMFRMGNTQDGRATLAQSLRLCGGPIALRSPDDVKDLVDWASGAWDYLAMGDYPYRSAYILNGEGTLPAYPVRAACQHLAKRDLKGEELLESMARAIGVFYNFTGELACYNFKDDDDEHSQEESEDFWSWQWCTEQFMPMTRDGQRDMFWPQPFDEQEASESCQKRWGVTPQPSKPTIEWGGKRILAGSNIVFTNGGLDPWSAGGVLKTLSHSMISIMIPEGAHHLDLMWSNEKDPQSVKLAREIQAQEIERWIQEARQNNPSEQNSLQIRSKSHLHLKTVHTYKNRENFIQTKKFS